LRTPKCPGSYPWGYTYPNLGITSLGDYAAPTGGLDVLERYISVGPAGISNPHRPIRSLVAVTWLALMQHVKSWRRPNNDVKDVQETSWRRSFARHEDVWEWWQQHIPLTSVTDGNVGRGSSVGRSTRYGLDSPGIEFRWGQDFPHPSRPSLGPTQPPNQSVPSLFTGGKAVVAWRWPPTHINCRG
jgi:hypothetical protein